MDGATLVVVRVDDWGDMMRLNGSGWMKHIYIRDACIE